ncbi:hypothetical protein GCM10022222_20880 [Amycolatopsis ultiminotia]|uniref:Uncharacterized protein n=1 Tax=Amycolatopsis ultiminotia TaxID=543629 RepID=A0ABP6VKA4_9PSEU
MLRFAELRPAAPADRSAAELADRTGIIAASVPRTRRSPEGGEVTSGERTQPMPAVLGSAEAVTRTAVVARRRRRAFATGGVALALVLFGWLAGGLVVGGLLGNPGTDAAVVGDQREPVAAKPTPPPAPAPAPAPAAAPVTVYVPVPTTAPSSHKSASAPHTSAPKKVQPREDTPAPATSSAPGSELKQFVDQQWKPWADFAHQVATGR